ncbi:MAG: hypothetical protein HY343_12510, partial [Lentisphaerae bacterium]|nr:hypothetical protein [Lentisphaerota bacterium]
MQSEFQKASSNPVVTFTNLIVNGDPFVLYDPSATPRYRMWLTGVRSGILVGDEQPLLNIFEATSTDGVAWSANEDAPVLAQGDGSAWDNGGVETPNLVQAGGQLALYYTGYPLGGWNHEDTYHLGRAVWNATSNLWVKDSTPLSIPGEAFSLEPNVVFDSARSLYRLWFFGLVGSRLAIFHAESQNGRDGWSSPVSTLEWPLEWGGPSPAVIRRSSGAYEMYFSQSNLVWRGMVRATSSNGLSWTRLGVVLRPTGGTTAFDAVFANAGYPIEGADGKIQLYYSGWKTEAPGAPSDHGVGLAVEPWPSQWGWPGAVAVAGDYDGGGSNDLAVFDNNTGDWYIRTVAGTNIAWAARWGWPGAAPVSGDY